QATDGPIWLSGLRVARLLEGLRPHPRELVDALARKRSLEPVEELSGRVDLVVMLAVREDGQFVEVLGEPGSRLGNVDKAVLDHRRLRVQAHDLVVDRRAALARRPSSRKRKAGRCF